MDSDLITRLSLLYDAPAIEKATKPTAILASTTHWTREAMQQSILTVKDRPHVTLAERFNVLGFTTPEFVDALKFFSYLVYAVEFQETLDIPLKDLQKWASTAQLIFTSVKIRINPQIAKLLRLVPPNKRISDKQYDIIYDLVKEIRDKVYPKRPDLYKDPSAITDLRNFMNTVLSYFNQKGESSYGVITKKVALLKDPRLSSHMRPFNGKVDIEPINRYHQFVRKASGRKDALYLLPEEKNKLTERELKKHNDLKKERDKAYKAKMAEIMREAQEQHLPAPKVKEILKKDGFPNHTIPSGFTGRIDENGKLYTKTGVPLATGQTGGTMTMNPDYDPKKDDTYVASGRSMFSKTNKPQHFYTVNFTSKRSDKKQAKAEDLEDMIDDLQVEWRKDFQKGRPNDKLLGAMLEMLYQTQARIGSPGNKTEGKSTYGLTTWAVKHVKQAQNGSLIITYPGKSGMINKHIIKPDDPIKQALIAYVMRLTKGKQSRDPLWTDSQGNTIGSGKVRAYLKELGFEGGPHAFRHYRGNQVFRDLLTKYRLKKNPTPKEVADYHKKITTEVGKVLGHQRTDKTGKTVHVGSTASKSYISPELQRNLFTKNGVPVPKALERVSDF